MKMMIVLLRKLLWMIVLSSFLLGANAGAAQEQDERAALQKQQQALQEQVATLKREQDFLLFRKAMYASDSKYLVLNSSGKTGQLMYKNRVLKDFRFIPSRNFPNAVQPGMLVLTKKSEGKTDRHALIFGTALIIQWKRAVVPKKEARIPCIALTKKEMLSLFSAIEEGATAYIVR
jgi:hypothetical protein